jgi:23S rRNA (uracil1939-C5)-methyltransferase
LRKRFLLAQKFTDQFAGKINIHAENKIMERKAKFLELKKNDIVKLTITGYTAQGSGVGRVEGLPIFVFGAARGDVLQVRVVKRLKTYAFGRIEKILEPSPARMEPDCSVSAQCGGCVFRHLTYQEELWAKQERVQDAVSRIGGIDFPVAEILPSPDCIHYRNKAQIPLQADVNGNLVFGFYAVHSHRIIPCDQCLLQPESFFRAMQAVKKWQSISKDTVYNEKTGKGTLRHLYLRSAMSTGDLMVCLVINGSKIHKEDVLIELLKNEVPETKSIVLNFNHDRTNVILGEKGKTLWGTDSITDTLCGLSFSISPKSFYQVNRKQAQQLYNLAAKAASLTGKETLLDLYCGTGTIGLSMANNARQVIGVEIVEAAVEDARRNAEQNQIKNARFFCGDASEAAEKLQKEGIQPDVVILDPPRKGCGEELIRTVVKMTPERIVYVSCDPATLARDLKLFTELGYSLRSLQPVDMFPRTPHVEAVCLLSKVNASEHIES